MSLAFVDLRKAFDTVDGGLLFSVLRRFGYFSIFPGLLRFLHTGNTAAVGVGTDVSEKFKVTIGVKQGCILAPMLSNVFLLAVTLLPVGQSEIQERPAGVEMWYRCDRGAFEN